MAEWVRALDWHPGGAGFESTGTSLRKFHNSVYPALPVYFGGDTKSRWYLYFYLVSMPGEVKDPTQGINTCVPGRRLPTFLGKDNPKNNQACV